MAIRFPRRIPFRATLAASQTARRCAAAAFALVTVGACSDKADEPTQPSVITASIGLSLASGTLVVPQGQSGSVSVSTTRVNFAGAIELSAEGAPMGVNVAFAPASLADGTTSSVMTVVAGPSATQGTGAIIVKVRGAGVTEQSATLTVNITPPPTIAVATPSAGVSLSPGITDFTPVTVTRTAFTAPVTLSVSGLPAGVTATVADAPVAGSATTIAVAATSSAVTGTSTVTITAQGTGVANATTTFPLTISAATGTNVQFKYCGVPPGTIGSLVPVWVAAQSGTNPWRQLTREAGETYNASISAQGGVVTVYQTGSDRYSVRVRYGTLAELQALAARPCTPGGTKPHTGSIPGILAGEVTSIAMGASSALVTAPATTFALSNLPDDAADFTAVRRSATETIPLKVIIRRGLTLPFTAVLPPLDFAAAEAISPIQKQATITNISAGEVLTTLTNVRTSNGTQFLLGARTAAAGASTNVIDALPVASLVTGDVQSTLLLAGTQSGSSGTSRYLRHDYRDATDITGTLGTLLENPTVSVVSPLPDLRMRATGNKQAGYLGTYSVVFNQVQGSTIRDASIEATNAWLPAAPTYTLDMPDFSLVAGWRSTFGFQGSTIIPWVVTVNDWTGAPKGFTPLFVDGVQLKGSERVGATTP